MKNFNSSATYNAYFERIVMLLGSPSLESSLIIKNDVKKAMRHEACISAAIKEIRFEEAIARFRKVKR